MRTKRLRLVLAGLALSGLIARAENTDPANDNSQFAWGENVGWINAEPLEQGGPGMQVDNFKVTGWLWGENIGWISLSCENTSSCGVSSYGVKHDSFGGLSGWAWSENAGWISIRPPGAGLALDTSTGDLHGFAWGENIGWIVFNCFETSSCGTAAYKVRTGWTCTAPAPVTLPSIMLASFGATTLISWSASADTGRWDLAYGSLSALRSQNGNFSMATTGCSSHLFDPQTDYFGDPAVGDGVWFLVRGRSCGGTGTFNSGAPKQIADRDPLLAASPNYCP